MTPLSANLSVLRYVTEVLLSGRPASLLKETVHRVKKIRSCVKGADALASNQDRVEGIKKKLARCYDKVSVRLQCCVL